MSKETFKFGRGQVYFAKAKPRSWVDRLLNRPRQYEPFKLFGEVTAHSLDITTKPQSFTQRIIGKLRARWGR